MNNFKYIVKFLTFTVASFMVFGFLPLIVAVLILLFLTYFLWYRDVKQKTELNDRFKNSFFSVLIAVISFYNAEPFKENVLNGLSSISKINELIYNDTQEILHKKPLTEIINYEVLNVATANESENTFSIIKSALNNDNSIVSNYTESKIDAVLLSNPKHKLNLFKGNVLLLSSPVSQEVKKKFPKLIKELIIFSKNKDDEIDLSLIEKELYKRNLFDKEIIYDLNHEVINILNIEEFKNIGNFTNILSIIISLNNWNFTELSITNSEHFITYLDKITELHRLTSYGYECIYELRAFSPHSFVASYIEHTNYILNYTSGIQYGQADILKKFNDLIYINCDCILDDVLDSMFDSDNIDYMKSNSNQINAESIVKLSEMFQRIFEKNKSIIVCWSKFPAFLGVNSSLTNEPIYMESLNKKTLTFNYDCPLVRDKILTETNGVVNLYNTHYVHDILKRLYEENDKFPNSEVLAKNIFIDEALYEYNLVNDNECLVKHFNVGNVKIYKGTDKGFELVQY